MAKGNFCSLIKMFACCASSNKNYAGCDFVEEGADSICKYANGHLCDNPKAQKAAQKTEKTN